MSAGQVGSNGGNFDIRTWALGAASAVLSGLLVLIIEKQQWIWVAALVLAVIVTLLCYSVLRSTTRRRQVFTFLAACVALGLVLTFGVTRLVSNSTGEGATASEGTEGCNATQLNGGGRICIASDPKGYQAVYLTGDNAQGNSMDLNLVCDNGRRFGDDGAFPAQRNKTYSYVFAVGSQGTCHVTLFNRSQGGETDSPNMAR